MSSRLFINLREKNGITYNVGIDNMEYEFSGCFNIITSVDRDKLIEYRDANGNTKSGAIPIIVETLLDLVKNGPTHEELEKIQGFLKGNLTLDAEDSQTISDYNGRQLLLEYPEFIPMEDLYTLFSSITKRDIEKVLKRFFHKNNLSIYLIGKQSSIEKTKVLEHLYKL